MEVPTHTGDPCPDPTAHSSHSEAGKLEDQAAAAALAWDHTEGGQPSTEDHKLSEASAAASLHYAKPKDLPSFPVVGVSNSTSSAGAAASLANANHKEFKLWKPDASANASKAAMLAKDYKPAPMWHHELGTASSKAALQAASKGADVKIWTPEKSMAGNSAAGQAMREGGDVKIWRPEKTEAGNSAAGQAMRKTTLSPQLDYGYTADGNRKALLAATGAMSGSTRKRAGSNPVVGKSYPDAANSAANALNAATVAHKPSTKGPSSSQLQYSSPALEASRITHISSKNVPRDMYGSRPPVALEVEERNKQNTIHAAAVSMAKQMYELQQKSINQASAAPKSDSHLAATKSIRGRKSSMASSVDVSQPTPVYPNLQEAAQRLAAERLAKLRNEHAEYRDYYGTNKPQARNSLRGRPRRRASSDSDSADAKQSNKIRKEMSLFTNQLAEVDAKKQQKDREALLAAAQRNVSARMSGMDQKVFADTGKVSPAMMEEWEAKARAKAEADSSTRMVNHGRVNIGGGKFLDQAEIDAVAQAKVQPTLDEISAKAEKQRERDEQIRLEQEEKKRIAREIEADEKRRDNESKAAWRAFKENERKEKETERARKAEEKRAKKEEAKKAKEGPMEQKLVAVGLATEPKGDVPAEETTTTGSGPNETEISTEAPALEPIAHVDPINVTDIEDKPIEESIEGAQSTELEPPTARDSITEHSVGTANEGMSITSAERIAERVVSAPVASKSQELVNPVAALETAAVDYEEPPTPRTTMTATEDFAPTSTVSNITSSPTSVTKAATTEEPATTKSVEDPKSTTSNKLAKTAPPITTTPSTSLDTSTRTTQVSAGATPTSPTKSGVRGWLKSKIARRASKPPKPESASSNQKGTTTSAEGSNPKDTAAASTSTAEPTTTTTAGKPPTTAPLSTSTSHNDTSSVREVAMAGRPSSSSSPQPSKAEATATALAALEGTTPAAGSGVVSPLSAADEGGGGRDLASEPAHLATTTGTGPGGWDRRVSSASSGISSLDEGTTNRGRSTGMTTSEGNGREVEPVLGRQETRGSEEGKFEEARDTFKEGLAPPPSLAKLAEEGAGGGVGGKERSPVRDSKFQEIL
ncbi:MAG: hypothetical protein M1836_007150 [Candelina mexicana]|nr:MAG: hypothetical protein M1836_007150 [Candelina mexicana]